MSVVLGNRNPAHDPLEHLGGDALAELASLLRYFPPSSHLSTCALSRAFLDAQRAAAESPRLPRSLRAGTARAVRTLLCGPFADDWFPPLCPAHRRLDGDLVGHLFRLLRVEVSRGCDSVRGFVAAAAAVAAGEEDGPRAPAAASDGTKAAAASVVDELSSLVELYLSAEHVDRYFGRFATRGRFDLLESGCPACVLAVVGGRRDVLTALRANLLGRARSRGPPRLLRFVDAWVDAHEERETMRRESDRLAGELRRAKRIMRKWRKQRKERREKAKRDSCGRGVGRPRAGSSPGPGRMDGVGVSMPHNGNVHQQHDEQRHSCAPTGAADAVPWQLANQNRPSTPDSWENVASTSSSAGVFDEEDQDEYIPARHNWPRIRAIGRSQSRLAPCPRPNICPSESVYSAAPERVPCPELNICPSESVYSAAPESTAQAGPSYLRASSVIPGLPRPSEYLNIQSDAAKDLGDGSPSRVQEQQQQQQDRSTPSKQCHSPQESLGTSWGDLYEKR